MRHLRPSRGLAAAIFASVGLIAGAAHVGFNEADNIRLWREVLPLAGIVGACLGAAFRPTRWLSAALTALLAILAFAMVYGIAETAILASRGEISGVYGWAVSSIYWAGEVLSKAAFGGIVAILAGAMSSRWLNWRARKLQ